VLRARCDQTPAQLDLLITEQEPLNDDPCVVATCPHGTRFYVQELATHGAHGE
jgi:hypothetical protein